MKGRNIIYVFAFMILCLCFTGCSNDKPSSLEQPLIIKDGGPLKTKANTVFNIQPDGNSAMWLDVENASEATHVMFGSKEIKPDFNSSKKLTFMVPRELYSIAGKYEIYIFNPPQGKKSNSLYFIVE
ncbi:MAG: hypothetical protein ACYDGO_09400 [Smithellaceae bacterium]